MRDTYDKLVKTLREVALLQSVGSVLGWDERTYMPPGGAEHRASQHALIARMAHEQFTAPAVGQLLGEVESSNLVADPLSDAAVNIREWRRLYDRARKLPASLVEEMSRTEVLGEHAWIEARAKSEFPLFRPWLEKWLQLKRQEAACVGHSGDPYDALLDVFEPGQSAAELQRIFAELRGPLVELVGRILSSGKEAPLEILQRHYPADLQQRVARHAAQAVGFDFAAGRLDVSAHPFCSGIGPGDTRMTTRYDEHYFADAFFGVLHETGHGLYDQGLDPAHFGTPRGSAVSLGIHESQSRMWENLVGRSREFWQFFFPTIKEAFPQALHDVTLEQWHFAVNDVRPSLIRTESDEVTYNLHVLLRFELERALLRDELNPADLPATWNQRMHDYLGVTPPSDAQGCLQDIHWAGGAIGYFPTYTLGNLYAAQFFQHANHEIPTLRQNIAKGEFNPLLQWLRQKIHTQGQRHRAPELVKQITGEPLSAAPLLSHLRTKAADLYNV